MDNYNSFIAKELTKRLDSKDSYLKLLDQFVTASIQEQYLEETSNSEITYSMFYERFIRTVASRNAEYVFKYCQSPIERVFLNSLVLLFVRNRMPCLHITPPLDDALLCISNRRKIFQHIEQFIASYKKATGDAELHCFEKALEQKVKEGKLEQDYVDDVIMHKSIIKHFEWNSYHISPQASFPELKINNKRIRADFFIWVPGEESVKIIVECDGFQYHSNKEIFERDRAKDRLFQLNGFRVIRFSGTEINKDPAKVSSELFDLLDRLDEDKANLRVL